MAILDCNGAPFALNDLEKYWGNCFFFPEK